MKMNQLRDLLITTPEPLRSELRPLTARVCSAASDEPMPAVTFHAARHVNAGKARVTAEAMLLANAGASCQSAAQPSVGAA